MQEVFGFLSPTVFLIGFVPYLIDIFRGKTKPERMTWLVWSVLVIISFSSLVALDQGIWSLVLPAANMLTVVTIFVLSIKYGVGGLLRRDIISLIIAAIGLLAWYITKQPLVALVVSLGIDLLGTYLTVVKTYEMPESETLFAWAMAALGGLFGMFAVGSWSFEAQLYPAFILLINASVVVTILLGRRKLARGTINKENT